MGGKWRLWMSSHIGDTTLAGPIQRQSVSLWGGVAGFLQVDGFAVALCGSYPGVYA